MVDFAFRERHGCWLSPTPRPPAFTFFCFLGCFYIVFHRHFFLPSVCVDLPADCVVEEELARCSIYGVVVYLVFLMDFPLPFEQEGRTLYCSCQVVGWVYCRYKAIDRIYRAWGKNWRTDVLYIFSHQSNPCSSTRSTIITTAAVLRWLHFFFLIHYHVVPGSWCKLYVGMHVLVWYFGLLKT